MNLAITKAVEQATDSQVTFAYDADHVHYDITKRISQIIQTVRVSISHELHRMAGAETVIQTVLTLAQLKFAAVRTQVTKLISVMHSVCPSCFIVASDIFENVTWIVIDSLTKHKDVYLLDAIEEAIAKEMGDIVLDHFRFDFKD